MTCHQARFKRSPPGGGIPFCMEGADMDSKEPFTVVMDWDSCIEDAREAPDFQVTAATPSEACAAAWDRAFTEFGDEAEYLYGVALYRGHPERVQH